MKIKVEKRAFLKTADIFITGIECAPENIAKLIDVFDFNKNIEIAADMGFAEESNITLEKTKSFKLKHKASLEKTKYSNGLLRLIASSSECKVFLKDVFEFDIEIICILGIRNEIMWKESPYYKSMKLCNHLIKQNILDFYVTAFIDDEGVAISVNKELYDAKKLATKIKALFLI